MTQSHTTLFVAQCATITVWGRVPDQQYTSDKATFGVVKSLATSQIFICAIDGASTVAAPVKSFRRAIKLNGPAITLCNEYGGVCILFKDDNTLKGFANSVANVAPIVAQALIVEEAAMATDRSESPYMSDSLLSEVSASSLSNFSDIEADDEEGLGWEFVDN